MNLRVLKQAIHIHVSPSPRLFWEKGPGVEGFSRKASACVATLALFGLSGCHTDMWVQPKVKPQYTSDFFPDQQAQRKPINNTVARGQYWTDSARYTGFDNHLQVATTFPFKITAQDMARGQERFNIYCSPCHGALGNGQGMIAQRGFALRRPPGNYHEERLRNAPVGHFYDVITNGYGTMYSYASRVEPDDRWRIVAYIRALQRSQNAGRGDVDDTKISPAAKTQIDSFVPQPGTNNTPGANGTGSTTSPAPLADTPVPNTPENGNRQPAPGTPPQATTNGPGTPASGNAPGTPATGNAPGAPTNTMPSGRTGSGTIRHAPDVPEHDNQSGARPPSAGSATPPMGGTNGTGNR